MLLLQLWERLPCYFKGWGDLSYFSLSPYSFLSSTVPCS